MRRSGIGDSAFDFENRGDGVLTLIDPAVPKNRLLVTVLKILLTQLDDDNMGRADRLRLRAVIHAGEVIRDANGHSGSAAIVPTRLLSSGAIRAAIQLIDADLVVGVTEAIYRGVVESHLPSIDPSRYRSAVVETKGTRVPMWITWQGGPPPQEPPPNARLPEPDDLHHRGIFIVDIEDSDSRPYNVKALHRTQVRRIVTSSIADVGLAPEQYDPPTDTGDGVRVLFAPDVPKNRLVGPLMSALTKRLNSYNTAVSEGANMRLRAVLSSGELRRDEYDYFGTPLNEAYWLLDSDELRDRLRKTTGPMVLMITQDIYDGVVRHGYPHIDPGTFESCVVTHKKRDLRVWLWCP